MTKMASLSDARRGLTEANWDLGLDGQVAYVCNKAVLEKPWDVVDVWTLQVG